MPKQFDIKEFEPYKNYVIDASAGTGKTYNIIEIVKKLVLENICKPIHFFFGILRSENRRIRENFRHGFDDFFGAAISGEPIRNNGDFWLEIFRHYFAPPLTILHRN